MIAVNFLLLLGFHKLFGFYSLVYAPVAATLSMNLLLLVSVKRTYAQQSVWTVMPLSGMIRMTLPLILVGILFRILQVLLPLKGTWQTVIWGPLCFGTALAASLYMIKRERKKGADVGGTLT